MVHPPKGHAILSTVRPSAQLLVAEDELVLIDRYFSRGDVVKKQPSNAESGTVIGTSCRCTVRLASLVNHRLQDLHSPPLEHPERLCVNTRELSPYRRWEEGDTVVLRDWAGVIEDVIDHILVWLDGGHIVVIKDTQALREIIQPFSHTFPSYADFHGRSRSGLRFKPVEEDPCYPGQRVRIKRAVLLRCLWLTGSYVPESAMDGTIINLRHEQVFVRWIDRSRPEHAIKPDNFLQREVLESGHVTKYDTSRCPKQADAGEAPTLTAQSPHTVANEFVRFRDPRTVTQMFSNPSTKRNGNLPNSEQHTAQYAQLIGSADAPAFQITSTISSVVVQWQDRSITEELAAFVYPYEEVDEYDVWPGELVSMKEQQDSYQDPAYEKLIRTRSVGVVQSVNANERVAVVRWFEDADITIAGEDYNILVQAHSKLGSITDIFSQISLYELASYRAIAKRRGDHVFLHKPEKLCPSSDTNLRPSEGFPASSESDIDWYGEIVDLLLDGQVLVRLGALGNVRDVKCSILDITIAASADDTTLDSSSGEEDSLDSGDTDMVDAWDHERSPISTSIEYNGPTPAGSDADEEDQWTTDSNDEASSDESTNAQVHRSSTKADATHSSIGEPLPSADSASDVDFEDAESSPKSMSGPASFEVLEGSSPKHTFTGGSTSRSKEWLRAVSREHKILRSSLPEGVYVRTWESSMELIRVLIVGPVGTPYALAPFFFDIHLHSDYPIEAPNAFFHSWTNGIGRVNPNLYEDGKVCLSLLGTWHSSKDNESWVTGKSSILQIIVSLLGLVLVKEPFYNEAGFEALQGTAQSKPTSAAYSEKAFVLTRRFVAKAVEASPEGFEGVIQWLYLPHPAGPNLLRTVIDDCHSFLESESPDASMENIRNGQFQIDPYLEAVIEVNPDALEIAAQLDKELRCGQMRGPFHGIPVLVKDNMATKDKMQTTAGSWALLGSVAPRDAFVVAQLRRAGAIILGHASMTEWASLRSRWYSDGYSPRRGQVRNAFDLSRSPCE
ncbi:MAG: hypothetical protein Q9222_004591 [Ikaeria aurantiellina]